MKKKLMKLMASALTIATLFSFSVPAFASRGEIIEDGFGDSEVKFVNEELEKILGAGAFADEAYIELLKQESGPSGETQWDALVKAVQNQEPSDYSVKISEEGVDICLIGTETSEIVEKPERTPYAYVYGLYPPSFRDYVTYGNFNLYSQTHLYACGNFTGNYRLRISLVAPSGNTYSRLAENYHFDAHWSSVSSGYGFSMQYGNPDNNNNSMTVSGTLKSY